ncbi:MAG: glycosyltransferase family 4 protein [Patescibacteria group bacterium]
MNIISISTDRNIWQETSAVRARMIEYGQLFDSLHIIVFSKKGHDLQLVQLSDNVWAYPTNSFNQWLYIFDAIRLGKQLFATSYKLQATSWLVTAQDPFETGFCAWILSRLIGSKLNIQIHTDFLSPYFVKGNVLNRIRVFLADFLLPKADGIRVVSDRIKSSLQATSYKLKASPIVLPIFVDVLSIENTQITLDLKEKYSQFSHIILMATRFAKEKNISLAIDAFIQVLEKLPRAGLIIVGSGPEWDNLRLKVKAYKLSESIIFEPWIGFETLISYYKTTNLLLNTSLYEGYGLIFAEAAACNTPIVSTDVGIASEVGATIADHSASSVAQKILDVLGNPNPSRLLYIISKEEYLLDYKSALLGLAR